MPSLNDLRWCDRLGVAERADRTRLDDLRVRTWLTLGHVGMADSERMGAGKYRASRFELLSMLAFPDADPAGLELVNDFHLYLFFVDDRAEEDHAYGKHPERLGRYFERHVAAIRDGADVPADDCAGRLLLDIRTRLERRASLEWLQRFAADVECYLMQGTLAGARHWTADTVPDLEEYRRQRAFDSAVFCMQDFYEVTGGGELPAQVLQRGDFARLRWLCTHVVAFANDLVSYTKEVRRNGSPNNLVHVVMLHEDRQLEAAIERVIALVNTDVAEFDTIVSTLPDLGRDINRRWARYIAGQRAFMNGNIAWSVASGRYLDLDSPFPELRGEPLSQRAL